MLLSSSQTWINIFKGDGGSQVLLVWFFFFFPGIQNASTVEHLLALKLHYTTFSLMISTAENASGRGGEAHTEV